MVWCCFWDHVRTDPGPFRSWPGLHHQVADIVTISTPKLGALVNTVNFSDQTAPWTFGLTALYKNLANRKLV
jgi:fumarylacetoacetate (FAA) hydrolase family protein